jgi:hypothetical protein
MADAARRPAKHRVPIREEGIFMGAGLALAGEAAAKTLTDPISDEQRNGRLPTQGRVARCGKGRAVSFVANQYADFAANLMRRVGEFLVRASRQILVP